MYVWRRMHTCQKLFSFPWKGYVVSCLEIDNWLCEDASQKKQGSTAQCGRVPKKSTMCFSISLTFKPYRPFKSSQLSQNPWGIQRKSHNYTIHPIVHQPCASTPPRCWASHLGAVAFRRGTTIASVSHLNAWCLSDYYWLLIMSLLQLVWLWQLPLPLPLPLYIIPIATTTAFTTTITMTMWMTMTITLILLYNCC